MVGYSEDLLIGAGEMGDADTEREFAVSEAILAFKWLAWKENFDKATVNARLWYYKGPRLATPCFMHALNYQHISRGGGWRRTDCSGTGRLGADLHAGAPANHSTREQSMTRTISPWRTFSAANTGPLLRGLIARLHARHKKCAGSESIPH